MALLLWGVNGSNLLILVKELWILEMIILEALYLGVINSGPNDYKQMLQNTMLSSEMNKL